MWIDLKGGDIVRVQLPTYPVTLEEPDTPFLLMDQSASRTYVAQSALIGADGIDRSGARPLYSLASQNVLLNEGGEIVLQTTIDGADVTKTFVFEANSHLIDVRYDVTIWIEQPKTMRMLSPDKTRSPAPATDETVPLAPSPYLGGALTTEENNYEKIDFNDIDEGSFQATTIGGWVSLFAALLFDGLGGAENQTTSYHARKTSDGYYLFGFTGQNKTIGNGQRELDARFYAGPKDQVVLEEIAPHLNLTVDYGFLWWIAIPLFKALTFFHDIVGNWGLRLSC